jgi:ankyrin repeat protein
MAVQYRQKYPLHVAVANNDLATAQQLLASGQYDVNGKDSEGFTPLQLGLSCFPYGGSNCASNMDAATAAFLIGKGAEARVLSPIYPDFKTTADYTLLHTAAFRGRRDLVDVLLKGGALADINLSYYDVNVETRLTPLMSAAWGCYTNYDSPFGNISTNGTIKLLLESGADPLPFGTATPPLTVMIKIPNQQLRKCGEVVGSCNAEEVKRLVQEWKTQGSDRSCPDSWLMLWEAQEQAAAAAKGGSDGGAVTEAPPRMTGRKLLAWG